MSDFIYSRTIDIRRTAHQAAGEGAMGYGGGVFSSFETLAAVALAVACSIQSRGKARANPQALPGDTAPSTWAIYIPAGLVPETDIHDRDMVRDDLGRQFVVTASYANGMGWRLTVDQVE